MIHQFQSTASDAHHRESEQRGMEQDARERRERYAPHPEFMTVPSPTIDRFRCLQIVAQLRIDLTPFERVATRFDPCRLCLLDELEKLLSATTTAPINDTSHGQEEEIRPS